MSLGDVNSTYYPVLEFEPFFAVLYLVALPTRKNTLCNNCMVSSSSWTKGGKAVGGAR